MRKELHQPRYPGLSRSLVAILVYLVGFAAVLVVVCRRYLIPAVSAAASAIERHDLQQRKELAATASLILAVVLFVLFAGLLLAFRMGRFFFPPQRPPRQKPTQYVDAWEESGRRMSVADLPPDDEPQ
jgi:hypothetical protein